MNRMQDWLQGLATASVAIAAAGATAQPQTVCLVEDGKARCAVYASASTLSNAVVRASVIDITNALATMSGSPVALHSRAPAKDDGVRIPILVGDLAVQEFGGPKATSRFMQGWRLVAADRGIGLIGETAEGIGYAAYELMDQLGCRWYMPGAMGEVIPRTPTVRVRIQDLSAVPATIYRNVWYADEAFKRRNRLGGFYLACSHAIPGSTCRGDPEVSKRIAQDIVARLDKESGGKTGYVTSVSLSPEDTVSFCQCEKCKALDAGDFDPSMNCVSLTDRQLNFCNRIVAEVNRKYPNVMFGMLAYVQYTRPPLRERPLPNLVPQIAPITYCRAHSMLNTNCSSRASLKPIVEGWGKVSKNLSMYHYAYNLAEVSCPYPMLTMWGNELPICYSNHLTFWMPETMANFESTAPGLYLGIRLSWYPNADPKAILSDFFTGFYGAAAEPMRAYWQAIDDAWTKVNEHAGCGFGHYKRFTPETMKTAREALDRASAACRSEAEKQRVAIANDCFTQFELFMKMRRDCVEGRFASLETDAAAWMKARPELASKYSAQHAFQHYGQGYFGQFFLPAYSDAARIAKNYTVLPVLREWRYSVDKEKKTESLGWTKPEFDDSGWKTTDPGADTWASLGLPYGYYGSVCYRTRTKLPAIPAGKRVFLWVGGTDGSAKLFVNGAHVPYVNDKGEKNDVFSGYCKPASFDITPAVKAGAENQITIVGTREFINELGTGGLTEPVTLYCEK